MADDRRVALCVGRFYAELADKLVEGARTQLAEAGITEIEEFAVPGAYELPLVAKYAAESRRFAAVVCLGAVIRGETSHYDLVCQAASDGILRVALDTGVPCGFGVLTVDSMQQAFERVSGGSKRDTGRHAVEAVLASLEARDTLTGRRGRAGFNV
jgi:6,7-dimethyl-8-ribityllumazine synthase